MPRFAIGDTQIELPAGLTPEQTQQAITGFRQSPEFDAIIDKRRGAPAAVRAVVGSAAIDDRLANIQRYYPDAQPYKDDNFVFTDPDTKRPTLYNPKGFDVGDVFSVGREASQAVGATLGATFGSAVPGVGTVVGAGVGTAVGGELFDIATRVGMGQINTQGVVGDLLDAATDFAAGAAGQKMGEVVIEKGVKAALGGGRAISKRLVDAFKTLNIDPPAGAITGSRSIATVEKTLEAATFSGDILQKQAETVLTKTGAAANKVAQTMAKPQTTQGAGDTIRRAAVSSAERFGFTQEKAYTAAFDLVGADTKVQARALATLSDTMETELSRAPHSLRRTLGPGIKMLREILSDAASDGGLPFSSLRQVRTDIGRDIASPLLSGSSGARNEVLKRIYGAMTQDMSATATAAGPGAAKKLAVADRFTRAWMDTAAKTMEKINRFDADERAFNFAFQSAKDGGSALARMRRNFLPEEWDVIGASVLGKLGKATPGAQNAAGDAFSVNSFLTNWNKLSPEAKTALFGGKRYAELRKGLDTVLDVMQSLKGVEKVTNSSNTARSMIAWSTMQTLGGALGGFAVGGDPQSAIAGAFSVVVAPRVAAKLITSPAFVKWLATPITNPNGIAAHVSRLLAIAVAEPEIKDEISQYAHALRGTKE